MEDLFYVVMFPQSIKLMFKEWFNECVLINEDILVEAYGRGAYLVPLKYKETMDDEPLDDNVPEISYE